MHNHIFLQWTIRLHEISLAHRLSNLARNVPQKWLPIPFYLKSSDSKKWKLQMCLVVLGCKNTTLGRKKQIFTFDMQKKLHETAKHLA